MTVLTLTDAELIEQWQQLQRDYSDHIDRTKGKASRAYVDKIVALRAEGFRRGIDLHEIPPVPRPADVVRRKLARIERQMLGLHRRAYTRAQATTREARLGQLAKMADALRDELRRAEEGD